MNVTVTIRRNRLPEIRERLKDVVERKFTDGADAAARAARDRAPVRTGTLRRSIRVNEARRRGSRIEASVSTDVPYARFVEYGTSDTPAQPFMTPAEKELEDTLDEMRNLERELG